MAAMSPFIVTAALHEGGEIGGPPGRDPTIIAVERGERVLSREQNAEYKAGGAGRGMSLTFNFNSVLPPDRTQMKIIVRDEFLPVMRELERSGY